MSLTQEIEAVSVARNQGIANLPGKKEKDCIVCSDRNNPAIGCKRSRTVCTNQSVIKVSMSSVL